jgi:hypothetical protein
MALSLSRNTWKQRYFRGLGMWEKASLVRWTAMEQNLAAAPRSAWRDSNPDETQESLECFDAVLDEGGQGEVRNIACVDGACKTCRDSA